MGLNANWLYEETQWALFAMYCRFLCLEKQAMGFLPAAVKTSSVVAISVMPPKQFRMLTSQILWQKLFHWKLHYYSTSPWKFVIDQSAVPKSVLRFVCVCAYLLLKVFLCYVCLPCEKKDLFPIRFIGIFFCVCISTSGSSCSLKRKCQMQTNIAEWTPKAKTFLKVNTAGNSQNNFFHILGIAREFLAVKLSANIADDDSQ